MKVLAVLGSPRINKNTDILINKVLEGVKECATEINKIDLVKLKISPCVACYKCGETGRCIIRDDMANLYKLFDEADVIIVGSPLYFNSVSSILKLMIDRCQAFWASKYILEKPSINREKKRNGVFICTAGSKLDEEGFVGALAVMDLFFKSINAKYCYNLLIDRTDEEFVGNRKDILQKAYELGKSLCK